MPLPPLLQGAPPHAHTKGSTLSSYVPAASLCISLHFKLLFCQCRTTRAEEKGEVLDSAACKCHQTHPPLFYLPPCPSPPRNFPIPPSPTLIPSTTYCQLTDTGRCSQLGQSVHQLPVIVPAALQCSPVKMMFNWHLPPPPIGRRQVLPAGQSNRLHSHPHISKMYTCLCLILAVGTSPLLWTNALVLLSSIHTCSAILAHMIGAFTDFYNKTDKTIKGTNCIYF